MSRALKRRVIVYNKSQEEKMRKNLKTVVMLLVALSMALSLTACGSSTTADVKATAETTDEYVYSAEFTTIAEKTEKYLTPKIYTDDGFYAIAYEKVGDNTPEGAVLDYEDQYAVYQSKIYFVSYDGSIQELTNYEPVPYPENTDGKRDYSCGTSLAGIALTPDGGFLAIESSYENWFEGPENMTRDDSDYYNHTKYQSHYYIRKLDFEGKEISTAEIDVPQDGYIYAYSMAVDKDGNAIVTGDMEVRVIAPDGSNVADIQLDSYADSIFVMKDGTPAYTAYGDTGEKLYTLDLEKKTTGASYDLPDGAYNLVSGSGEYDVYFSDGSYLCGFNLGDEKATKLFNWINCDINGSEVSNFKINDDGTVLLVSTVYNSLDETYTIELAKIAKVLASSLPQKDTLTLATMGIDWEARNLIINFNRKSTDCRIVIKDYSEYNTEEDITAGTTKLTTELLAGNVPDIIDLNGLSYSQIASKGILADLYPYIDSDTAFSRDDFFQNVFEALEVDGKLCATCSGFSINALVGAEKIVGDKIGWTYDDFYNALAQMPEGCEALDVSTTRYEVLKTCLSLDLDQYVDWETGKCNFDSDAFKQMLEFTSHFQESFDWDNHEWTSEDNADTRIAEGRQMLMQAYIGSFTDIRYYDFYFGGDATYIGYPTLSGNGNMLSVQSGFAMSEKSAHKDQIWSFLRQFFTEDFQAQNYGLPTNKNVFEKLLKKEMTPEYKKDASGNYALDENGEKIEVPKGSMGSSTGEVYNFYALTQKQADKLTELVEGTSKISESNDKIYEIVEKHARAYYAGDKTLDETAKFIQSEANIYVNEQK